MTSCRLAHETRHARGARPAPRVCSQKGGSSSVVYRILSSPFAFHRGESVEKFPKHGLDQAFCPRMEYSPRGPDLCHHTKLGPKLPAAFFEFRAISTGRPSITHTLTVTRARSWWRRWQTRPPEAPGSTTHTRGFTKRHIRLPHPKSAVESRNMRCRASVRYVEQEKLLDHPWTVAFNRL